MDSPALIGIGFLVWFVGLYTWPLYAPKKREYSLPAALVWPVVVLCMLAARGVGAIPPLVGEEARLRRRLRAVEKEHRLLGLRRQVEDAESAYSAELNRFIDGDLPSVKQALLEVEKLSRKRRA